MQFQLSNGNCPSLKTCLLDPQVRVILYSGLADKTIITSCHHHITDARDSHPVDLIHITDHHIGTMR